MLTSCVSRCSRPTLHTAMASTTTQAHTQRRPNGVNERVHHTKQHSGAPSMQPQARSLLFAACGDIPMEICKHSSEHGDETFHTCLDRRVERTMLHGMCVVDVGQDVHTTGTVHVHLARKPNITHVEQHGREACAFLSMRHRLSCRCASLAVACCCSPLIVLRHRVFICTCIL